MTAGGVFLVAGAYDPSNLEVTPTVLLTGLLSGLTYGLYSIFGRPVTGHLTSSVILSFALFFGSLLLVVCAPHADTAAASPTAPTRCFHARRGTYDARVRPLHLRPRTPGRRAAAIVATVEPVVAGALGTALLAEVLTVPSGRRTAGDLRRDWPRSAGQHFPSISASQLFGDHRIQRDEALAG